MQGISWLAAKPVSFSRRTLLHGVSKWVYYSLLYRTDTFTVHYAALPPAFKIQKLWLPTIIEQYVKFPAHSDQFHWRHAPFFIHNWDIVFFYKIWPEFLCVLNREGRSNAVNWLSKFGQFEFRSESRLSRLCYFPIILCISAQIVGQCFN